MSFRSEVKVAAITTGLEVGLMAGAFIGGAVIGACFDLPKTIAIEKQAFSTHPDPMIIAESWQDISDFNEPGWGGTIAFSIVGLGLIRGGSERRAIIRIGLYGPTSATV